MYNESELWLEFDNVLDERFKPPPIRGCAILSPSLDRGLQSGDLGVCELEVLCRNGAGWVPEYPFLAINELALELDGSLDDSYWDGKALLSSATVAATQAALTMETVRATAPVFAEHVTGIATDFHSATTALDKKFFNPAPKNKKQKVLGFFSTLQTILIAALRGGAL